MARQPANASGTQSVERTVALLLELATSGIRGARLIELATRVGIEYPTAHRIAGALVKQRLVVKDPVTRRYSLGPLIYELGLAARPRIDLRQLCEPMMQRLADTTGDTIFLNIRSGYDAVCIDRREGSCPIKALVYEVGARRPLGIGAGGLALLMQLPWADIQQVIQHNTPRFATYGKLSVPGMLSTLKRARDNGYMIASNVLVHGVTSVALPFGGQYGLPLAAVTVSTVSSRMPASRQQELAEQLRAETQGVEKSLSGRQPLDRAA